MKASKSLTACTADAYDEILWPCRPIPLPVTVFRTKYAPPKGYAGKQLQASRMIVDGNS